MDIRFNAVSVIESFKDNEPHPGKELYEDLLHWKELKHPHFSSNYHKVENRTQLLGCLAKVNDMVDTEDYHPILHFEMHGSKDGIKLSDDTFVGWYEIKKSLQNINIALCNNLLITMASCYGAHLIKTLCPTDRSPALLIIGNKSTISFSESKASYLNFYDNILSINKFGELFDTLNINGEYTYSSCLAMFKEAFSQYFINECAPARVEERVKEILDEAKKEVDERLIDVGAIRNSVTDTVSQFETVKELFFMTDICPMNKSRFPIEYTDITKQTLSSLTPCP